MYNSLQQREIFHLEFLRWFSHKVDAKYYALKGGVNMRFFFNSLRYSEDMDIDVSGLSIEVLQDMVLEIFLHNHLVIFLSPMVLIVLLHRILQKQSRQK